ncbi:hypothetical protein BH23PLA1_BH23PLA1_34310 [soil metagenome]
MPRHSESVLAAIKGALDIVSLVGDYLPLHRAGSKYKALCPFHDDHHPSLELNTERQSFKCWSCGAGGDVFDFVMNYERVEFPEAVRMLAERAGVVLEADLPGNSPGRPSRAGVSKTELLAVNAWAEGVFAEALGRSAEARAYLQRRGLSAESVARFRLGYAPEGRDWLLTQGRRAGFDADLLEVAGLVGRGPDRTGAPRDRFRGRLMFPIHDVRGRTIAFGGRILPETERKWVEAGRGVAKYLNTPETLLFQKRRTLYATDLARTVARQEGWVGVVEGYTDVIAAHQVGLSNVVGTLGTALGDDHVPSLRRLAECVVLVFDGDEAGQKAADRGLELFLGNEIDAKVLALPEGVDPCDFLLSQGADAFRALLDRAADPLAFVLDRAEALHDFDSVEDARRAAGWVLAILARIPNSSRAGLDVKVAKALDALARRLRLPVEQLRRDLAHLRRPKRGASRGREVQLLVGSELGADGRVSNPSRPIRPSELDPLDRELIEIILNEPSVVSSLITRVSVASLRDAPLRAILQTCYDLHGEGQSAGFERVSARLDDPAIRSLAAGLLLPIDPAPLPERIRPAPWQVRLQNLLPMLDERQWHDRVRDLKGALGETDPQADPEQYRALRTEYLRLINQRPGTKN